MILEKYQLMIVYSLGKKKKLVSIRESKRKEN